jgi:hypothetical protein
MGQWDNNAVNTDHDALTSRILLHVPCELYPSRQVLYTTALRLELKGEVYYDYYYAQSSSIHTVLSYSSFYQAPQSKAWKNKSAPRNCILRLDIFNFRHQDEFSFNRISPGHVTSFLGACPNSYFS